MKNVKFVLSLAAFFCFSMMSQQAAAQIVSSACQTYTVVGQSCVGACGDPGEIAYTVAGPCSEFLVDMCVSNDQTSLCPTHGVKAGVYVNGTLVATGDLTNLGSSIGFSAPCGSVVKVIASLYERKSDTVCVWLGEVDFSLRRG